ncbi:hypothetical protein AMS68_007227 [Peltaster fructicola]|uniref:3-dehydrosphinganine reductase n=1 Tax=Peltaster fructicola TaxID=286661 RepID=A0A6H0Y523_9PEZI|nr:hypothetical protein AMS68_007227 [Peltaster fructicola]
MGFSRKNQFNVDGKTILLTGGSQGMGRAVARLLSSKGANVVIVARNPTKLGEAFKYISAAARFPGKQRFHAISADVTAPGENDRIIRETTIWNDGQPPDVVWANAGSSHPGLFLDTSEEIMRRQMDLNYWAANSLARSTLHYWTVPLHKDSKVPGPNDKRHFIITASVVCFIGVAGYSPYSPAKAALRSLADTLKSELNLYNGMRRSKDPEVRKMAPEQDIDIHFVAPGTITSPGFENEQKLKHQVTKEVEKGDAVQSEDEVAAAAVQRLEAGEFIITTQFAGHVMRASMFGPSPKNNFIVDTLFAWLASIIWLFVTPDLHGKVYQYGKKYGTASIAEPKK